MPYPVRKRFIWLALVLLVLGGSYLWLGRPAQHPDFRSWFESQRFPAAPLLGEYPPITETVVSEWLNVKGIQRSMQGPYDLRPTYLNEGKEELIWLTGYRTTMLDSEGKPVSDGFMCHNNLNIQDKQASPWRVKTHGSNIRLFTLTEGQTEVQLPVGFALPLHSGTPLEVVSQVLNHNEPEANFAVQQHTEISYFPEDASPFHFKPLYQQSVFVTKQTDGPVGDFGSSLLCNAYEVDSGAAGSAPNSPGHHAVPYNPYQDEFGRHYTGHWEIGAGPEVLITDVTQMINLEFDTRIHYIGAHLHPFGESLTLLDATTGDTLHTIYAKNHSDRIGLQEIGHYSSAEGIPVFKGHTYHLISTYVGTESLDRHTAMATLFLFLHDHS